LFKKNYKKWQATCMLQHTITIYFKMENGDSLLNGGLGLDSMPDDSSG